MCGVLNALQALCPPRDLLCSTLRCMILLAILQQYPIYPSCPPYLPNGDARWRSVGRAEQRRGQDRPDVRHQANVQVQLSPLPLGQPGPPPHEPAHLDATPAAHDIWHTRLQLACCSCVTVAEDGDSAVALISSVCDRRISTSNQRGDAYNIRMSGNSSAPHVSKVLDEVAAGQQRQGSMGSVVNTARQ